MVKSVFVAMEVFLDSLVAQKITGYLDVHSADAFHKAFQTSHRVSKRYRNYQTREKLLSLIASLPHVKVTCICKGKRCPNKEKKAYFLPHNSISMYIFFNRRHANTTTLSASDVFKTKISKRFLWEPNLRKMKTDDIGELLKKSVWEAVEKGGTQAIRNWKERGGPEVELFIDSVIDLKHGTRARRKRKKTVHFGTFEIYE